jgi:sulfate transport system permease protein
LVVSLLVVAINAVFGTVVAWVLVRDEFPGEGGGQRPDRPPVRAADDRRRLDLDRLYGPKSPLGINVAYSRAGVGLALLFITLPFVVRAVQPVLAELDREMEEAAAALGAGAWTTFRLVVLPNLLPAILAVPGSASPAPSASSARSC